MRVVIQRVLNAKVTIDNIVESQIGCGLLVFLGIEVNDIKEDALWLAKKIKSLRIFNDDNGVMNKSVVEKEGDILVVSQFTLHAKTKKGNRPSYIKSALPDQAKPLYRLFKEELSLLTEKEIKSGRFGSDMKVELTNDGPVTIIIDSKNKE
jgi:D-tyrosyl-tRNA(Tyr) deacylase